MKMIAAQAISAPHYAQKYFYKLLRSTAWMLFVLMPDASAIDYLLLSARRPARRGYRHARHVEMAIVLGYWYASMRRYRDFSFSDSGDWLSWGRLISAWYDDKARANLINRHDASLYITGGCRCYACSAKTAHKATGRAASARNAWAQISRFTWRILAGSLGERASRFATSACRPFSPFIIGCCASPLLMRERRSRDGARDASPMGASLLRPQTRRCHILMRHAVWDDDWLDWHFMGMLSPSASQRCCRKIEGDWVYICRAHTATGALNTLHAAVYAIPKRECGATMIEEARLHLTLILSDMPRFRLWQFAFQYHWQHN